MGEKCALCSEKIEESFLGKFYGTIVKIKNEKENKNQPRFICSSCQKKFPDIKSQVLKLIK